MFRTIRGRFDLPGRAAQRDRPGYQRQCRPRARARLSAPRLRPQPGAGNIAAHGRRPVSGAPLCDALAAPPRTAGDDVRHALPGPRGPSALRHPGLDAHADAAQPAPSGKAPAGPPPLAHRRGHGAFLRRLAAGDGEHAARGRALPLRLRTGRHPVPEISVRESSGPTEGEGRSRRRAALRCGRRAARARASGARAERHRRGRLCGVFPGFRRPGGVVRDAQYLDARARQRGRQPGVLRARHQQRLPVPLRPHLRAIFEPRADAVRQARRHRPGPAVGPPGRGDPPRFRALRQGTRRHDRRRAYLSRPLRRGRHCQGLRHSRARSAAFYRAHSVDAGRRRRGRAPDARMQPSAVQRRALQNRAGDGRRIRRHPAPLRHAPVRAGDQRRHDRRPHAAV